MLPLNLTGTVFSRSLLYNKLVCGGVRSTNVVVAIRCFFIEFSISCLGSDNKPDGKNYSWDDEYYNLKGYYLYL